MNIRLSILFLLTTITAFTQVNTSHLTGTTGNVQTNIDARLPSQGRTPDQVFNGSPFPLPSGVSNYWALGDSQTRGEYSSLHDWTDGSKILFESLRYPNIIASRFGLNLTNRAVSGTRISFSASGSYGVLAQANAIPIDWTGLVTVASGYNDSTSDKYGSPLRAHSLFRSAFSSVVSKLYATTYTDPNGTKNTGASDPSFTTDGTVEDLGYAGLSPFPVSVPASDTFKVLRLDPGDSITFDATNAAVWLRTYASGGTVDLWQGTNWISSVNCDTESGTTWSLPQVALGIGRSGTFSLTNSTGTNFVMAVGSVLDSSACRSKTVIVAAPNRLGSSIRVDGVGALIGYAAKSALEDWQAYPAFLADFPSRIDLATMIPAGDADHPDPRGQAAMADAIAYAVKPSSSPEVSAPAPRWTDQGLQVYGIPSSISSYISEPSLFMSHTSGVGYFDSYDPATGLYGPLYMRNSGARFTEGGVQIMGGFDSISDYGTGDLLTMRISSGTGFIDGNAYDGVTLTYIPINVRAKTTSITQGGFQVQSASSAVSNLVSGSSVLISNSSGQGYIDSATSDGSALTYQPLNLRAERVAIPNGFLQVLGTAASNTNYAQGSSLVGLQSGSTAYIQSQNYNGSSITYNPFVVRASTISMTPNLAGGIIVTNATAAGTTRLYLYDVDNATLEHVTVGAADSGGAGFKVLRIPN